jgi:hypothetical protein
MHKHFRSVAVVVGLASLAGMTACGEHKAADIPTAVATAIHSFEARDFSGIWDRYPQATDSQRDITVVPRPEAIPPPPLKPEFKAAFDAEQKKIADANARGEPIANGYTNCQPDGMPSMMMAMFPMEVVQIPGKVVIIQEAYNQVRRVYMNETLPPVDDAEPGFWGHAVGRWEGDVLVIDTIGIKDYVRFRNAPHSANMQINERLRKIDADHFENDVTLTDPEFLTQPWQWKWVYQRRPNYKMYEYVCEDNREYADPKTGVQRLRLAK